MQAEKYLCFELTGILEGGQASKDFNDFIRILLAQEQDIRIWSDGMYVSVEYDYADRDYGCPYLVWVDPAKEYVKEYAADPEEYPKEKEYDGDVEPEEDPKEKEYDGDDEEIPQPANIVFLDK